MNRIITYGIDRETDMVISRVNSEVAWPVLDYEGMQPENNFAMYYTLEKMPILSLGSSWRSIKWTKKIPVELKNRHREFWGFKSLVNKVQV